MRRMTETDRGDSGVATIFVILAMTTMVVGAALAIDVGGYVAAARSAQNSADATVLAVATDCALTGAPIADYSPYRKVGQTITTPACGSGEATVTVTKEVDGLLLAQSAGDVNRSATARWGTLKAANTVPLVIADCEFREPSAGETVTLYLDDPKPQSGCSSLPGGFSQLDKADCSVPISAGGTVDGVTGVGGLQNKVACLTNPPPATALPHTVLIPIYSTSACQAIDCKGKGPYLILGFAALKVTGYSLNGNVYDGSLGKKCPDEKDRGKYCIRGTFIKFTTSRGTPGPSTDFGVSQVFLYS
jgi:Flp pilus assembly protein TadG